MAEEIRAMSPAEPPKASPPGYPPSIDTRRESLGALEPPPTMSPTPPSSCLGRARRFVRKEIVTKWWFDAFVLFLIIFNCVTLAMDNPLDPPNTTKADFLNVTDKIFIGLFALEAVLKIFGLGFGPYFGDPWNDLDFVIVVAGFLTLIDGIGNFSAIRIVRVLRPLRALNRVQGLKVIVVTLLGSLKALLQVALLVMFLFTIYSIIAVQLFNGVLRRRCVDIVTGEVFEDPDFICGSTNSCPSGFDCQGGFSNPADGAVNFDNFAWSLLNVYVITSLANWIDIHYPLWDATTSFTWVFFVTLILFGSFFALNLVLAVIADAFAEAASEQRAINDALEAAQEDEDDGPTLLLDTPAAAKSPASPMTPEEHVESLALEVVGKPKPDRGTGTGLSSPKADGAARDSPVKRSPPAWASYEGDEEGPGGDNITQMFAPTGRTPELVLVAGPGRGSENPNSRMQLLPVSEADELEDKLQPSPPTVTGSLATPAGVAHNSSMRTTSAIVLSPVTDAGTPRRPPDHAPDDEAVSPPRKPPSDSDSDDGVAETKSGPVPPSRHKPPPHAASWSDVLHAAQGEDEEAMKQLQIEKLGYDPEQLPLATKICQAAHRLVATHQAYLRGKPRIIHFLNKVVLSKVFKWFIVLAILGNTITLSMEHHDMPTTLEDGLEDANLVFTSIFIVEMVLKLFGLGWRGYIVDRFNIFDAVIVIVSIVELGIGGGGGIVSVFRAFRLLRVLKLAKSFMSLRILLATVGESVANVSYMTLLLLLFVFMFSVLGLQLFAGTFTEDLDPPADYHFDTLAMSILSVFQILTGDDWPLMMHDARSGTGNTGAVVYFIFVTAFGMYVVISLFIAILLERFALQDELKFQREDLLETATLMLERSDDPSSVQTARTTIVSLAKTLTNLESHRLEEKAKRYKARTAKQIRVLSGKSLNLFSPENKMRKFLFDLVANVWFEVVVIVLIFANCVFLAMENPGVDDDSDLGKLIKNMDVFFAVVFTIEMIIKIVAWGAWSTNSGAYFRNAWNGLDAFVVLVSIVSLAAPSFSVARSFRALRPLRVVVRSRKIQVVLNALILALPNIANVMALLLIFWMIFAILGVSLFAGKLYACNDETVTTLAACVGTFMLDGETVPREWANVEDFNFDNIGEAVLALFRVATLSGWGDVTRTAMSAVSTDEAPIPEHNPAVAIYFYVFIVVCSFFALNLFIGVVIDNFNRLRNEYDGSAFLTAEQRQWANMQKLLSSIKLKVHVDRPSNKLRLLFFDLIMNPKFDLVIMFFILLNTITMMFEHYDQPEALTDFLFVANNIFVAIFTAEAVFKIIGTGFLVYWREDWNKFDFVVVALSLFGLFVDAGVGANVVRVFRIARVFRLINKAETLRNLFQTLTVSVPSLWNIGSLLFVLFFIFAVLGVSFFGDIDRTEPGGPEGLTRHANFETFGLSLLTLWRLATGDAWELPMYACRDAVPMAPLYFIAFVVFGGLVMVNLFIAVILENFGEALSGAERAADLKRANLWVQVWQRFDPRAQNYVPAHLFTSLMFEAPEPFGFRREVLEEGDETSATPSPMRRQASSRIRTPTPRSPTMEAPLSPHARVAILKEYTRYNVPLFPVALNTLSPNVVSKVVELEPEPEGDREHREGWPGPGEVWALKFNPTLKALAKVVIALDVDIEQKGTVGAWLHEWYAALIIQRLYRAQNPSMRRFRKVESQRSSLPSRSPSKRRGSRRPASGIELVAQGRSASGTSSPPQQGSTSPPQTSPQKTLGTVSEDPVAT